MVGERIKKIRIELSLTQKDLGKLCNVGQVQIARYENGKTKPTEKILKRLSKGLNMPVEYFNSNTSPSETRLDMEYYKLKKVIDEEGKSALLKIFKSLYISSQPQLTLKEDK